jgi:dihydroorotate dehydrogenase (NAD+) catalytic subunit
VNPFASLKSLTGRIPLATVSGVATTNEEMIRYFDREIPDVDLITTKSFQVVPNPGNPEPVICETQTGCFGNSVGLKNVGMKEAQAELKRLRGERMRALLNVSLSANSPEDFITLIRTLCPYADLVELNFSCPHAAKGYGASIGCDASIASMYVRTIRKAIPDLSVPLFVKLTPNVPDIGSIAKAVMEAGADGITAINTVGPVEHRDPDSGYSILINKVGGKGGKSGLGEGRRASCGPRHPKCRRSRYPDHRDGRRIHRSGSRSHGAGGSRCGRHRQCPGHGEPTRVATIPGGGGKRGVCHAPWRESRASK